MLPVTCHCERPQGAKQSPPSRVGDCFVAPLPRNDTHRSLVAAMLRYDQRVDLREGEPIPVKGNGEEVPFSSDEPLRLECQAFLSAMETRRPPLTDGISGLRVLKVLQAAQRSLVMNGEPVALPMETFTSTTLHFGQAQYKRQSSGQGSVQVRDGGDPI